MARNISYITNTTYPIEKILYCLGIEPAKLQGKKILDIGCGAFALFPEFLRKQGINVEAIDPNLWENNKCMMKKSAEHIPKPSNYYDLVLSHRSLFQYGSSSLWLDALHNHGVAGTLDDRKLLRIAARALKEGLRVLKPGGQFIIYPEMDEFHPQLEEIAAKFDAKIELQPLNGKIEGYAERIIYASLANRLVLNKF